jgi:hypothetical protein
MWSSRFFVIATSAILRAFIRLGICGKALGYN